MIKYKGLPARGLAGEHFTGWLWAGDDEWQGSNHADGEEGRVGEVGGRRGQCGEAKSSSE